MITGTPGTGKTAASRVLSERTGYLHIELSKLSKEKRFVGGYDKERNAWIVNLKEVKRYLASLASTVNSPYIILDGHLAHLVSFKADTEIIFILRCHPEELEKRLKERGYSGKKLSENILSELLDTVLIESLSIFPKGITCEIDTTGKEIREVVDKMLSILDGREEKSLGEIDWITMLANKGKLTPLLKRLEGEDYGFPHHPLQ